MPAGRWERALLESQSRAERSVADQQISLDDWASLFSAFSYNGVGYPFLSFQQTMPGQREEMGQGFTGYVQGAYRSNGIVFACILLRLLTFSEVRLQFQRINNGKPGALFGTDELAILEHPWPNATTGDLLARGIQDVDMAGNFFCARRGKYSDKNGGTLKRMRPDWVTIVAGSASDPPGDGTKPGLTLDDIDAELLGYIYHPGGARANAEPVVLLPEEVCHWAPIPDPLFSFRGMSWLEPVIREVMADGAATTHKLRFFENGATPNMVVSLDPQITKDAFDKWIEAFERKHTGIANAYKTLYLGGGATATVVGANLRQMDFKITQGAGETRIAAAAGCPPVLVGLSEGLDAATYSNYEQAKRRYGDATLRPLWRNFCGSLETVVRMPPGNNSRLWYDASDVSFLKDSEQDEAEILQKEASTIQTLINSGFKSESVKAAVGSRDLSLLEHTGLYSVQLQPPGLLGEPGGPTGPPSGAPAAPAADDTEPTEPVVPTTNGASSKPRGKGAASLA